MTKNKRKVVETVNQFGDHACPFCNVMIINPLNCVLVPGLTICPFCKRQYKVSKKIAEIANENSRKYDKALDKVIKEIQNG